MDKLKECNLKLIDGQSISTPVIENCELHFECKVVYQQTMEPGMLDGDIRKKFYPNHDYHVLYFGEILDSYIIE